MKSRNKEVEVEGLTSELDRDCASGCYPEQDDLVEHVVRCWCCRLRMMKR